MLTLFTIPKPFTGAAAVAQDNAVESWRRLGAGVEILLFGDEHGIADAAARHGVVHVPSIRRNQDGTPLVGDAIVSAQARAQHEHVAYVNADIILLPSLLRALERLTWRRFLMVGQRTDLEVPERIDFTRRDWAAALEQLARREGRLHEQTGIDYFVFPRGQITAMPAFPVGRALWDNWMIYHARASRIPVVDATATVLAVHQNHDYGHVAGGRRTTEAGAEVQRNWEMVGPDFMQLTIVDATWELHDDGVRRPRALARIARQLAVDVALRPPFRPSVRVARRLYRAINSAAALRSARRDRRS